MENWLLNQKLKAVVTVMNFLLLHISSALAVALLVEQRRRLTCKNLLQQSHEVLFWRPSLT